MLLEHGEARAFEPFDRFAHLKEFGGWRAAELLDLFERLRQESLASLRALRLQPADLARRGRHPALGAVTLGQLLATWVVHDLGHVAQIARVQAKQYREDVGAWGEYLPVLQR
ncbi:MAG: DinB family protein [Planctomycetes bacterium]|nr:DinB family protein [Planctomycetota bacterium]